MKVVERRRVAGVTTGGVSRFRGPATRLLVTRGEPIDETSVVKMLVGWAEYTKSRSRHAAKLGRRFTSREQSGLNNKRADRYVKHLALQLKSRPELVTGPQRQAIVAEIARRLVEVTVATKGPQRLGAVTALMKTLADDRLAVDEARKDLLRLFKVGEPAVAAHATRRGSSTLGLLMESLSPAGRRVVQKRPELLTRVRELESETLVTLLPRNVSGLPLEEQQSLAGLNLKDFRSDAEAVALLRRALATANLVVISEGDFDVVAKGSARDVQRFLGTSLALLSSHGSEPEEPRETTRSPSDLYVSSTRGHVFKAPPLLADFVDHIVFFPPSRKLATGVVSAAPPRALFPHLTAPELLAMLECPSAGHPDANLTGEGVKVAVVDTGVDVHHPAMADLVRRGAKVSGLLLPLPPAKAFPPLTDLSGHGTAMAWNVLTCAPRAEILSIHDSPLPNVSLSAARDSDADIVICCFDLPFGRYRSIEARIVEMVQRGKVVLAAAGNGSQAFPGNMDEVISVGGVFQDSSGQRFASQVASGYDRVHLGGVRTVPDVCGPCGEKPPGVYFAMPCPAGSSYDVTFGGLPYDQGDGLGTNDGWWFGSGTSGATSLVGGVCALLLEKARKSRDKPTISTNFVKNILQRTAFQVTQGKNAMGNVPNGTPNNAVGYGLVDAGAALGLISAP